MRGPRCAEAARGAPGAGGRQPGAGRAGRGCPGAAVGAESPASGRGPAARAAGGAAAGASGGAEGAPSRYAFLHDFCMGMPYGLLALLAGVALAALLGGLGRSVGLALALGGMATLAVSAASIRRWKAGGDSRFPHTVALLGVAAGEACAALQLTGGGSGLVRAAGWGLAATSALFAAFCMYNLLAGGNPPRTGSH